MGCLRRVGVVVGELEAGDDEQAVPLECSGGLALELGDVVGVVRGGDASRREVVPGIVGPADVVCDAQEVEAAGAVEIDEGADRERAVAPGRMGVQLREQPSGSGSHHAPSVAYGLPLEGEEVVDLQERS